jgi:hypothetical protein
VCEVSKQGCGAGASGMLRRPAFRRHSGRGARAAAAAVPACRAPISTPSRPAHPVSPQSSHLECFSDRKEKLGGGEAVRSHRKFGFVCERSCSVFCSSRSFQTTQLTCIPHGLGLGSDPPATAGRASRFPVSSSLHQADHVHTICSSRRAGGCWRAQGCALLPATPLSRTPQRARSQQQQRHPRQRRTRRQSRCSAGGGHGCCTSLPRPWAAPPPRRECRGCSGSSWAFRTPPP